MTKAIRITLLASLAAFLVVSLAPMSANAALPVRVFTALLNGAQEAVGSSPAPTPSEAVGNGLFTFTEATSELCVHVSFNVSLLTAPVVAAHIHGPAAPGVAAPVIFPLGTANPIINCFILTKSQEKDLKKGLYYVNIHTNDGAGGGFPSGELRGQILPVKEVKY
jgi:hypothetical protein